MPTTFKPLIIAWAVSLFIVISGLLLLEATYEPAPVVEEPANIVDSEILAEPEPPRVMPVEAITELLEMTDRGPLPIIDTAGREPSRIYAANSVPADGLNKIAIIVTDLGPIARNVRRALAELPTNTTLAFSPYGAGINGWAEQARRSGHETMLMVPMEPNNYPQNDPGPLTLLVNQTRTGNLNLLRDSLGKMTGYTGIVNHMGERFTAAGQSIRPVLEELKSRGLLYIDSKASAYSRGPEMAKALSIPTGENSLIGYLDEDPSAAVISEKLDQLEQQATENGFALGIARSYPVTIDAIVAWEAGLTSRGAVLVPVTQLIGVDPARP